MYVHSITEFIETLRAQEDLESYDKKFLDDIATTFLEHDGLTSLDSTQIEFLVEIFNRRWNNIKDTPKDYTLCDDFINRVWAKLAEELASELRISFISVLIPSIKNRIDPITFTKLPSNYTELQQLYLSHDNSTIHSLNNLVTRFKEGNYSTYGDIRKVKPRALSPLEMSRIRAKVTGLPIVCDSQCYTNFWSFVTDRVFPLWQKEGELPSMVSSLSDVVQSYYENDLNTSDGVYRFRKDLITWSENLLCYPLKEVNHLYGISITISPFSSRYLAEILSDALLVNPILIGESIKAIAIWLALRDPSLIIRTPALQATYFELRVGPGFGAREFLEGIKTLFGNDDKRFERELTALMVSVQEKIQSTEEQFVIDPSDLQRLKIIYGQRWEIIRGGVLDYTQTQTGSNSNWIRLAQLLAGAGYLSYNYYLFLMPSIRREFEPISLETISRYPLSHYILSESGRDLIFLGTCAAADGRLFNFNQASPSELTTLERNRILCADGRYLNLLDKRCPEDPPISIRTVNAIKRVLDDCLYARDEAQKLASEYALLEFYPFLRQISEDEKQRLYAQKINYRGAVYSFKNIMEEIEKGECITAHLRCLVRLVVDYLPDAKFSLQVESKVPLAEIRKYSARKVLREYEDIDVQEVKTRLLIILFSLLTHEFDYLPLTGWKISACGRSNTVPKHVEPIFRLIAPLVTKNFKGVSAQRLRHIYGQIVEGVIKPTLEDNGWNSWFTLFEGTKAWMNSILSGTLLPVTPCVKLVSISGSTLIIPKCIIKQNPRPSPLLLSVLFHSLQEHTCLVKKE
ncbi:hypothetical protein [Legionella adelaidensis]|uniref:hypothetical protein n=1 Tax=Legionella adelaidensis TaxID=45056 RepID=UPI00112FD9FC|nr:hypothetical protein [Legionella adelaidensis]